MELLDRYIEAVRAQLPRRNRDDIAAELRESLLSEFEDEQAARGRPLTDDEIAAILKRVGDPHTVAVRYGARDHLIGPRVYPFYVLVVKGILWVGAVLVAAAAAVAAFTGDAPLAAVAQVLWVGTLVAIANLTLVTLLFARMERSHDVDSSRDLPRQPEKLAEQFEEWREASLGRPFQMRTAVSGGEAVASIVVSTFWLLWWTDVLPINRLFFWSRVPLEPAAIWYDLTSLIVGLNVAMIAVNAVVLVWPRLVRVYAGALLLFDVGLLVMVVQALAAPAYVVLTDESAPAAALASLLNGVARVGLTAFAVLIVGSIVVTVRRWVTAARWRNRHAIGAAS